VWRCDRQKSKKRNFKIHKGGKENATLVEVAQPKREKCSSAGTATFHQPRGKGMGLVACRSPAVLLDRVRDQRLRF
jgi:hypothetical protein